jgi:hypothetical protein
MSRPENKFNPVAGRRYFVSDQRLYEQEPPANYNPLDPYRTRHIVQLIDIDSGTILNLMSGSIVEIVKAKKDPNENDRPLHHQTFAGREP